MVVTIKVPRYEERDENDRIKLFTRIHDTILGKVKYNRIEDDYYEIEYECDDVEFYNTILKEKGISF